MKAFNYIEYDESITIKYRPKGQESASMKKPHVHDSYEVYFLLEGERKYFIHDRSYRIKKGMIVLIKPSVIHRTVAVKDPDHERLLMIINQSFLEAFAVGFEPYDWFKCFQNQDPILLPDINQQSAIREALFQAEAYLNSEEGPQVNRGMLKVLEALMMINEVAPDTLEDQDSDLGDLEKKIGEVAAYINSHYGQAISLDSLANDFYFSPSYLSRHFKSVTGFGLNEYINNVRVLEAEKLLQQSNLPISDIAQRVGYDSHSHFGRVFKKVKDMTPNQYRKIKGQIL